MYKNKLMDFINSNKEEMFTDLEKIIAVKSISSERNETEKGLKLVLEMANTMGFKTENFMDGEVGVIEMGEGVETLGILTHIDVVSPGPLEKWNTDPFKMEKISGNIYGRGVLDDKGPLIMSLYAMKAVNEIGEKLHKKVQLIIGTQEEVQWTDMNKFVNNHKLPDYGFTPDGEFPICNIEKGVIDVILEFPKSYRGKDRQIVGLKAGEAANIVPDSLEVKIRNKDGKEEIKEYKGKAVHSSQPEKGENAIANFVDDIYSLNVSSNSILEMVRMIEKYYMDQDGKSLGLDSESEYYNGEFVHKNIFTVTLIKEEIDRHIVNINVRFAYGADSDKIIERITLAANEYGGAVKNYFAEPAVFVSKEKPFLKCFAEAYKDVLGIENKFSLEYGGTYAKAFPNVVSWGPILEGGEDTCHEANEYMPEDDLIANCKIFATAIAKIALSEDSFK